MGRGTARSHVMTIQRVNVLRLMASHKVDVPKAMAFDGKISHGAFRLHVVMRSMPEGWNPTVSGFATVMRRHSMKASTDTVSRWVRQLERAGYLERTKVRTSDGKWGGQVWASYPQPKETWLREEGRFIETLSASRAG